MKKFCAVFALFLLLLLPFIASAEVRIIDKDGNDVTKDSINRNKELKEDSIGVSEQEDTKEIEEPTKEDAGYFERKLEDTAAAAQTAFENALNGFTYGILDQLMEGSVTIFEAETEIEKNPDGSNSRSVTYKIKNKIIDPFAPEFVQRSLMYTGGFYGLIAIFVILGSYIMLLIHYNAPIAIIDALSYLKGEERPYDNSLMNTVCVVSLVYWIAAFILIFGVTGCRNLFVYTVSPNEVILPAMYTDSIPYYCISGLSSFNNAFQSAFGTYGIYTFTCMIFVIGAISNLILLLGAVKVCVYFNVVTWGSYILFNLIDVINTASLSAGVEIYLVEGNPVYVTVGMVFGGLLNLFIAYKLIKYTSSTLSNSFAVV